MGTMRRILVRWGPTIVGFIKSANTHNIFRVLRNKSIFDTSILSPALCCWAGRAHVGNEPNIYAISLQKSIVNSFSIASSLCLSFSFATLHRPLHLYSSPSPLFSSPYTLPISILVLSIHANIHIVSPNIKINHLLLPALLSF